MQLTKRELQETQMIVTTPEKWDVITRKGGDVAVSATVKLLIIDEVHLLNDDRGPVIETLIARTQRQVRDYPAVGCLASHQPCVVLGNLTVWDAAMFMLPAVIRKPRPTRCPVDPKERILLHGVWKLQPLWPRGSGFLAALATTTLSYHTSSRTTNEITL